MSEEEIKQEIEQVGYKEFYRYYIETHKLAKQYSKELQQKENIIKEVREYIENGQAFDISLDREFAVFDRKELLEILDKGDEK